MPVAEIQRVCFVGAGTMGCYNATVAAVSGYAVTLYDIDAATLAQAPGRCEEFAALMVAHGYCAQADVAGALQRIQPTAELSLAVADADLVSESIVERLESKRAVHRQLDAACPAHTILTTNTSALLVSAIEGAVARGDRFAALHSHLGAPLVDVVGGARTSAATLDILQRYVRSLGGVPLLLKKEHPGYVLNAMLGPLLSTGMWLVSRGDASVETVDRAWMRHRNAPMGPFGMMDLFGLNLVCDSWRYRDEDEASAHLRAAVLDLLQPHVDRGELGMKSGRGFYNYPQPAYQRAGFVDEAADLSVAWAALAAAWIGNAVVLAALDVAEPADIDRAWTVGTHLDAGPFAVLEHMGRAAFLQLLAQQVAAGRFDAHKSRMVEAYLGDDIPARQPA